MKKKSTERKRKLQEWSKRNREKQGNRCQICGSQEHLNCHHIIPKEKFPQFQFEDWNACVLCVKHHKFGKYSAHGNPIWFADWLRLKRPEEYEFILQVLEYEMYNNVILSCDSH